MSEIPPEIAELIEFLNTHPYSQHDPRYKKAGQALAFYVGEALQAAQGAADVAADPPAPAKVERRGRKRRA